MFKLKLSNKKVQNNTNGFTIIEVALVLAIAAMIFLVVFLAVPALQRNQRDDARKRDVSNVVAAIEAYYGNSGNGALVGNPSQTQYVDGAGFTGSQLGSYIDKLSKNIDVVATWGSINSDLDSSKAANPATYNPSQSRDPIYNQDAYPYINVIRVYTGYSCNANSVKSASPRQAAVAVQLESGGNGKYYCQDAS